MISRIFLCQFEYIKIIVYKEFLVFGGFCFLLKREHFFCTVFRSLLGKKKKKEGKKRGKRDDKIQSLNFSFMDQIEFALIFNSKRKIQNFHLT